MNFTLEFERNTIDDGDWWFSIGIAYQKTPFHPTHRKVVEWSLGFYSVYLRW
jgi:hypothetical protein